MAQTRTPTNEAIAVYVREGESNDVRTLSFNPPDVITQADLLEHGYAIDGRAAVYSVIATVDDDTGEKRTLMDNLLFAERDLVAWLGTLGYKVQFR